MLNSEVYLKRQKLRRAITAMADYRGGDAATEFTLPVDIALFAKADRDVTTDEDYVASVNGINRAPPDIAADTMFRFGYFKRGTTIQAFSGFSIYIDAGLGNYVSIGAPRVPILSSDFKNGIYTLNGVSKTLAEIWTQDLSWSSYSSANVVAGTGLVSIGTPGGTFVGPVTTALAESGLLDGYVAVYEYELNRDTGYAGIGVELNQLPGYANEYSVSIVSQASGDSLSVGDFAASTTISSPIGSKAAIRLVNGSFAASIDGASPIEVTGIAAISGMNAIALSCNTTGDSDSIAILKKIEFFAPGDYALSDLPLLSR